MTDEIYLVRHGETEWSANGRHTGLTNIPLTPRGEEQARAVGRLLVDVAFSRVLVSPLGRARRTCDLAGIATAASVDPDLVERDYGDFEGRTLLDIRLEAPGWDALRDDCPRGESHEEFAIRAERVALRLRTLEGRVAVFSHGHFLRALSMCWIRQPVDEGSRFLLGPASLGILAFDRGDPAEPVIALWNRRP